jgi:hypothetical protein
VAWTERTYDERDAEVPLPYQCLSKGARRNEAHYRILLSLRRVVITDKPSHSQSSVDAQLEIESEMGCYQ